MKVWYLNHYCGSIEHPQEGRAYFLGREVVKNNISFTVICSSFHHLLKTEYVEPKNRITSRVIEGINFHWIKTKRYEGNGLGRFKNMLSYSIKLLEFLKKDIESPDVIICSSVHPYHIFSAYILSKWYKSKLVFEVRDIWPLSLHYLLNVNKSHPLYVVTKLFEMFSYKASDGIITLLPSANEHIRTYTRDDKPLLYLPNGSSDSVRWSELSDLDAELIELKKKYRRLVFHTGSIGIPNGVNLLVEAANSISDREDVGFVIIGKGSELENLKNSVISEHIFFYPPVRKNQVQAVLRFADITFCGSKYLPELYTFGVSPNKIFDYMLSAKPIAFAVDAPLNPVRSSNCGLCCSADGTQVVSMIESLCSMSDERLNELGLNGRNYLNSEHDFSVLAERFNHFIKGLLT